MASFEALVFPLKHALLHPDNIAALKRDADLEGGPLTLSPSDVAALLARRYESDPDIWVREIAARARPDRVRLMVEDLNGGVLADLRRLRRQHEDLKVDAHFRYAVAAFMKNARIYGYDLAAAGSHAFDDGERRATKVRSGNPSIGMDLTRE